MAEVKNMRLNKVLRELNISLDRAVDFLKEKGHEIEARPTTKISAEIYEVLSDQFQTDASKKVASKEVAQEKQKEKDTIIQIAQAAVKHGLFSRKGPRQVIGPVRAPTPHGPGLTENTVHKPHVGHDLNPNHTPSCPGDRSHPMPL